MNSAHATGTKAKTQLRLLKTPPQQPYYDGGHFQVFKQTKDPNSLVSNTINGLCQDKTGNIAKQDNDLLVTSLNDAKVGDKVQIQGTVGIDKDFGAGYSYSVLVENAKVELLKK